jgi:hypothetical protein
VGYRLFLEQYNIEKGRYYHKVSSTTFILAIYTLRLQLTMTPSAPYQVHDNGIYHGLPVYPSSLKGLTAIVTGANGISGNYMMRVLAQSPERWSKIYCLSRRPPAIPGGLPDNVEHIPLDFLKSPEEIAQVLKGKGVKADYVFFFSYIQVEPKEGEALWSNAEEMCKVNSKPRKLMDKDLRTDFHAQHPFFLTF